MIYWILAGVALFVGGFLWWRYKSVDRGAAKRDLAIVREVDPLESKILAGEAVAPSEIALLAAKPHVRLLLHSMLKHYERLDLFPNEYLDQQSQAESHLVYWLCHPNELGAAPDEIELLEKATRTIEGREMDFYVFRFCTHEPHWSAGDGWTLGVAGPFYPNKVPYSAAPATFSTFEKEGQKTPAEIVDWVVDMSHTKTT